MMDYKTELKRITDKVSQYDFCTVTWTESGVWLLLFGSTFQISIIVSKLHAEIGVEGIIKYLNMNHCLGRFFPVKSHNLLQRKETRHLNKKLMDVGRLILKEHLSAYEYIKMPPNITADDEGKELLTLQNIEVFLDDSIKQANT